MKKSLKVYFYDILKAIDEIETFIKSISWDEFKYNIVLRKAVERNEITIGEIVYDKIPKEFKERYKDIPWKEAERMRHLLIHHYSRISTKDIWDTAKNDLPKLKKQIQSLYEKEIKKDETTFPE